MLFRPLIAALVIAGTAVSGFSVSDNHSARKVSDRRSLFQDLAVLTAGSILTVNTVAVESASASGGATAGKYT